MERFIAQVTWQGFNKVHPFFSFYSKIVINATYCPVKIIIYFGGK